MKLKIFLLLSILYAVYLQTNGQLPDQGNCGFPGITPVLSSKLRFLAALGNEKIINGQRAIKNSWPWMVSLRYRYSSTQFSTHICGGSLIYRQYVITAAHCFNRPTPSGFFVMVGLNSVTEPVYVENAFTVSEISIHPSYSNRSNFFDIAIIKLSRPVTLSNRVGLVCLPTALSPSIDSKSAVITGWGSTTGFNSASSLSPDLLQASMTAFSVNNICKNNWPSFDQKFLCAFDTTKTLRSNICYGDSGGPLVYKVNNKWTIYGVNDFGFTDTQGKCLNNLPSYYANVQYYLGWLSTIIKSA